MNSFLLFYFDYKSSFASLAFPKHMLILFTAKKNCLGAPSQTAENALQDRRGRPSLRGPSFWPPAVHPVSLDSYSTGIWWVQLVDAICFGITFLFLMCNPPFFFNIFCRKICEVWTSRFPKMYRISQPMSTPVASQCGRIAIRNYLLND